MPQKVQIRYSAPFNPEDRVLAHQEEYHQEMMRLLAEEAPELDEKYEYEWTGKTELSREPGRRPIIKFRIFGVPVKKRK